MALPHKVNPLTRLWTSLATSLVIVFKLSEYFKLTAMVQVIGFVEDEKCFSNLNFIKTKLQNWLTTYLLIVKMFAQEFYTLEDFPYAKAIATWKDMKVQYGFDS